MRVDGKMCIVISHGKPCESQCRTGTRFCEARSTRLAEFTAAAAAEQEDSSVKKPALPAWPLADAPRAVARSSADTTHSDHGAPNEVAGARSSCRMVRDRVRRVLVSVTPEERAEIKRKAQMAGMSVAGYLRASALNAEIRSIYDFAAIRDLCRVSGDLGRFGGLLKLWLAERKGEGASAVDVDKLLRDARAVVEEIRQRIVLR